MKISIKDFFSKCNQICIKLRFGWTYLVNKSLTENLIFCAVLAGGKKLKNVGSIISKVSN